MTNGSGRGPYEGFRGKIGRTFASSRPWWPPRPAPPAGAPNVVVVLADDVGFSDFGCYGSEIPTPHIDTLAANGLRYVNFHVTPLCSPTRAALMTGRNAHAAGMGYVANIDPGFPGYASELPENQPTMAEVMRANGYATLMVGKWHLCKDSDLSEAGSRHSWPLQRGFDQYYGFLEALTNFHHPHRLYEGNSVVQVDQYPDGYYLTDDLTDRALRMIREVRAANPARPFMLYFAHGAVHAPLHAKPADIARHRGRYDAGWDALRNERFARQLATGLLPDGTRLPPRNSEPGEEVAAWDSLSAMERVVYARYMEVYAAMVESIDRSVGRIRGLLAELGELDNTVFIVTSDNGASREGRDAGTTAYFRDGGTSQGVSTTGRVEEAFARLEEIGGPTTWPHYPRGWAMACNTPFRMYKVYTLAGGHQVPFVFSWPARIPGAGQVVRRQYTHITDVLPTLVDVIGLTMPAERAGQPADPLAGASFSASIEDPAAASAHPEQYYECVGNRAYYQDGWEAVTTHRQLTPFSDDCWQLYHTAEDPTQCEDLADAEPGRVKDLTAAWEQAAWANQVFPLYEGTRLKYYLRPPQDADFTRPVRILAGTPTLERWRSSRLIADRSFRIMIDWAFQPGDQGVLVAHGEQGAGYLVYVEDGLLHLFVNEYGTGRPLAAVPLPGPSGQVTAHFDAPGGGVWNIRLDLDGRQVAAADGIRQFAGFLPYSGIDVGIDRRSPVCWELYQRHGAFPFTGTLHAVTYQPGELAPDAGERLIEQTRAIGLALE